jgi:hypothetical protein
MRVSSLHQNISVSPQCLFRLLLFISILFSKGCEKTNEYEEYSKNLSGKIEKEWHLDSISIQGSRVNLKATLPCVSDDKFVFRYDNTYTYFNNQTEHMLLPDGYACGDSLIFDILLWEILSDTLLNLNGTSYEIDLLAQDEMVLRKQNDFLQLQLGKAEKVYDYKFYYARESFQPSLMN